jgi:pimeloyl-ACP methyl ester carboxylesterase
MGADVYLTMWGPSEFGPSPGACATGTSQTGCRRSGVPTLVTGGRYDEARPAHLAVLAEGIPDAELVIFENSSHMAFIEEREPYIQVVNDFLARAEASPAPG